MANMSYCMFENTVSDLEDCFERMEEGGFNPKELSRTEKQAYNRLIEIAQEIAENYGHVIDEND